MWVRSNTPPPLLYSSKTICTETHHFRQTCHCCCCEPAAVRVAMCVYKHTHSSSFQHKAATCVLLHFDRTDSTDDTPQRSDATGAAAAQMQSNGDDSWRAPPAPSSSAAISAIRRHYSNSCNSCTCPLESCDNARRVARWLAWHWWCRSTLHTLSLLLYKEAAVKWVSEWASRPSHSLRTQQSDTGERKCRPPKYSSVQTYLWWWWWCPGGRH